MSCLQCTFCPILFPFHSFTQSLIQFIVSKTMVESLLLHWVSLCLCHASASALLSPTGVNYEVRALMDIKAQLSDPRSVLEGWDPSSVDPCSWPMVTCSSDSLVTGLGAPSQNLSGKLSPSVGNLTNLRTLALQNNIMEGKIPEEMGRLTMIQTVDLSNNSLTGMLPSSLGNLRNLQYLRLSNNKLSGSIPVGMANLNQLNLFDVSFNNFNGPVPRVFAKTYNVLGNPLICPTGSESGCSSPLLNASTIPPNGTQTYVSNKRSRIAVTSGISLGCICVLVIFSVLLLWWRHRRLRQSFFDFVDTNIEEIAVGNLKQFRFKELLYSTERFSDKNILGKGGFGNVYKGRFRDGTIVAIKRLNDCKTTGAIQFHTEVETISLVVHRNLLRLYGFCITPTERLLVYPYMSNGSVASRLKEKPVLDWATRKKIELGAGRGLLYLHEQCDPKIIHRDVKAANILLDDYCEAVVGDFGLAKLMDHQESHVTTAVRGTVGHIAPEYLSTGQSSEKTDVFGFGILLLELVTGQKAIEFGKAAPLKGIMLDWVRKLMQDKKLHELVDKQLKNNYDGIELEEMVQIALHCTQFVPLHRPKMSEVVRMLEGDGVAERWEEFAKFDPPKFKPHELSLSERYSDLTEDSQMLVQAIELSGPR